MAKIRDREKPSLPPVEPGSYTAICVHSIEVGEQKSEYNGKTRYSNKVVLVFELCGEFIEIDGKQEPRTLSRTFTMSSSEKGGLRKFVTGWTGRALSTDETKELDTNDLVGRAGMISVVLNEAGDHTNIDSIMALPRGMNAGQPVSPLIKFDIDPWDQAAFDALPEWAQSRIKESTNWAKDHPSTETIAVQAEPVGKECPI